MLFQSLCYIQTKLFTSLVQRCYFNLFATYKPGRSISLLYRSIYMFPSFRISCKILIFSMHSLHLWFRTVQYILMKLLQVWEITGKGVGPMPLLYIFFQSINHSNLIFSSFVFVLQEADQLRCHQETYDMQVATVSFHFAHSLKSILITIGQTILLIVWRRRFLMWDMRCLYNHGRQEILYAAFYIQIYLICYIQHA